MGGKPSLLTHDDVQTLFDEFGHGLHLMLTKVDYPAELYDRMRGAKNFQSAMQMARQLEFAIFDFRLHREYDPKRGGRIYEILDQVRDQVAVIKPPAYNRFVHSFSHIFAGGYAA